MRVHLLFTRIAPKTPWRQGSARIRYIQAHRMRAANYFPLVCKTLELANSCVLLYKSMDDKRKREILDTVYSNFLLDGKNLTPVYKQPFDLVVKMASCSNWLPVLDEFRNFCYASPPEATFTLPNYLASQLGTQMG